MSTSSQNHRVSPFTLPPISYYSQAHLLVHSLRLPLCVEHLFRPHLTHISVRERPLAYVMIDRRDETEKDLQRALSILKETLSKGKSPTGIAIRLEMYLRSALNRNSDKVLLVSTGGSPTALSTYLRLLINGCAESGTLFVAGSSSDSHDFNGVALWGPPRDDWLPWCVPRIPGSPVPNRPLPRPTQGRGRISVPAKTRGERLDSPPRES